MITVSAVIPTFNRAGCIGEATESALRQEYPCAEVIVVDDGSTDGTAAALRGFGNRVTYLRQDANRGVSIARNVGIKAARGQWIAFLDSDDVWLPHKTKTDVRTMEHCGDVVAVASNGVIQEAGGQNDLWAVRGVRWTESEECRRLNGVQAGLLQPLTPGVTARRSALERLGGFRSGVKFEDMDLWSRLALEGSWGCSREPTFVVNRASRRDDSLSWMSWKEPLETYRSLLESHIRLRSVAAAAIRDRLRLRRRISGYRCMLAASAIDSGHSGGWRMLMQSALECPTVRSLGRASAVAMGWRPRTPGS